MDHEAIELKRVKAQPVVAVRDVVSDYEDIELLFDEVEGFLAAQNIAPAGPRIAVFYDTMEGDRDLEVAATVPVERLTVEPPDDERVMADELPQVETMASLAHTGDYEELDRYYDTLLAWAEREGYRAVGPRRLVQYEDRMEIQLPVQAK